LNVTFHILKFDTLILSNECASLPKAGAQCGSSARWDLSGGHRVTGVPTGILPFCIDFTVILPYVLNGPIQLFLLEIFLMGVEVEIFHNISML
jgi:hypothetical protein